MNPLFNNPHQRGSSIYNICAPKTMMFGSCPPPFSDSYYKRLSTNIGNKVMAMESMGNATPTKGILDSVQGIFMNVLKISPNQSHQQNHQVKPKEFNFNYQNPQSGSTMKATPTSPIKIDPKQAGKAVWAHTPTKSPVDISTFTIVSPVASTFFDLESNGSGNTCKDEDPSNENAPNNMDLSHMQTISEEEDKEKEESQEEQEKVKQIIMVQEPVVLKDNKAAAEAKRLKEINKCKHRFNPLKINHKDPRKNIKEKWRRKIEKDILEDYCGDIAALNLNDSLESLDIEQVHSTDNIARSQAVPIPNSTSKYPGYSAEEFPSISASSSLSVSAQNHQIHLPEIEDEDEYVVLNSDTPKSTPIHSPRKSMKLCERFNRLFHNHSKSISPGTSPSTIMIPIRPRERQMSECSEDSFIVFFDPDSVDNPQSSSYINEYIDWGQVDDDDDDDEETEEEEDSDDSDETEEENDEESASETEQEAEPERNIQFDLETGKSESEVEAENQQSATANGHSKSDGEKEQIESNQALESLGAGSKAVLGDGDYIKKKRRRLDGSCKVRFDTEPTVHVIRAWNYAYRAARKGPWEQIARDTERFKLRCLSLERLLAPVLSQVHRDKIYQQRFMNSSNNVDGDNGNDANGDDSDHEPVEK